MNKTTKTIAKTAIFLALLLAMQFALSKIGIQLLTGSVVNLILFLAVIYCEFYGGIVIALISPLLAFAFGISAQILTVPFIALGNLSYVLIIGFANKLISKNVSKNWAKFAFWILAILLASFTKFGIISLGVTKVSLPLIIKDKPSEKVAQITKTLTKAFTWTQLFTALIGGGFGLFIHQVLNKTLKKAQ